MEKKENGIPRVGECTPSPGVMPRMGENGGCTNHTCGGDGGMLDDALLAYVYAPNQKFRMLYSAQDALSHGTLFEELYKPMGVYGNE